MGRQGQKQAMRGLWRLVLLGAVLILWGCATPSKIASPPAIPQATQEAQHFLDVGAERFRENDVTGAIEAFTKAVELNPQLSLAYYARAKARTRQNDLAGAMADYTQAVEVEPRLVNAYYFRGLLRAQQGERDGAMADFTQAVDVDSFDAQALFQRGLLRAQQGDRAGAIQDLQEALKLGIPSPEDQAVIRNTLRELER